jgi:small Trp-rich protein
MVFILMGALLVALKLTGMAPVSDWSWFLVLAPFALAVAWWAWSDKSGRTQRQAMRKDQARKDERRRNIANGMGLLRLFDRKVAAKLRRADERDQAARQKQIDKIVAHRERQRQAIRDSVLTTRMDSQLDSRAEAASTKPGKP